MIIRICKHKAEWKCLVIGVKTICWKVPFLPLDCCCQISWAISNTGEVQAKMPPADGRPMLWGRESVEAVVSEMSLVESRKELKGDRPVKVMNNFGGHGKMGLYSHPVQWKLLGSLRRILIRSGSRLRGSHGCCTECWQREMRAKALSAVFFEGWWLFGLGGQWAYDSQRSGSGYTLKGGERGRRETSQAIMKFWSVQLEELRCRYGWSRRSRMLWWRQELSSSGTV